MQKYAEVIDRVERVRKQFGLNKSRFSSSMGIKPQTYNNFIGKQASKPNIDLVIGLVSRYNVNPEWLLKGVGPVQLVPGNGDSPHADPAAARAATDFNETAWAAPAYDAAAMPAYSNGEPSIERAMLQLRDQMALLARDVAMLRGENRKLLEALGRLSQTPQAGQ